MEEAVSIASPSKNQGVEQRQIQAHPCLEANESIKLSGQKKQSSHVVNNMMLNDDISYEI